MQQRQHDWRAEHRRKFYHCHHRRSALCWAAPSMPISDQLEEKLQEWLGASIVDPAAADRIRAYESSRGPQRTRWPVVLAIVFGTIMVAAGVLLFVAAH